MQRLLIAHSLGIAGEVFNFAGAVLLGVDLFRRGQFRKQEEDLMELRDFAVRNNLQAVRYMNVVVALPDFQDLIAEKRSRKYGIAGATSLALGFALLVGYHAMEICDLLR
jgi:hypothetical protein